MMVMKRFIGLIGICSSLCTAHTPLEIAEKLSPVMSVTDYITKNIASEVPVAVKRCLLAEIAKALATKDINDFWPVSLGLDRGRTTQMLFPGIDEGYVANVLFSREWIMEYPEDKNVITPLCSMAVSLENIKTQDALKVLGITEEERTRIVDECNTLAQNLSEDSEDQVY